MSVDIERIKRRLLVKYKPFGAVMANLKYVEEKGIATAGTDGEFVYYNPEFVEKLSEEEQTFLFAHEVCHVAFNHIFRSEGKNPRLWNIATDAVINQMLIDDGLPMIEGGVDMAEAINKTAEEMYEKLVKEERQQNQSEGGQENPQEGQEKASQGSKPKEGRQASSGDGQKDRQEQSSTGNKQKEGQDQTPMGDGLEEGQQSSSSGDDKDASQEKGGAGSGNSGAQKEQSGESKENNNVGHDTHELWEKAVERRKKQREEAAAKEEAEKEEKSGLLDKLFGKGKKKESKEEKKQEDSEKSEAQKEFEERIKELSEMGEKKFFEQNKIERKKQLEELREALARESVGAGSRTDSKSRNVGEIGVAEPLIDWRRVLKEALNSDVDWSYRNATIEEGVVTPHLEEFPIPETEILLDTSDSINQTLLRNFLRECKNILQNSKVKVGCFDVEFYGFEEVRHVKDIDNMTFRGGGGTDFDVAVNAFSRRVENKIIFTDGWADMPEKTMDVIWIVFGDREINPKGGRVIRITPEQLKRLERQSERGFGR